MITKAPVERISYSVAQAAQAVGFSRYALYDAIRDGELRAFSVRKSGRRMILAEDLRAWITRQPVQARVGNG